MSANDSAPVFAAASAALSVMWTSLGRSGSLRDTPLACEYRSPWSRSCARQLESTWRKK